MAISLFSLSVHSMAIYSVEVSQENQLDRPTDTKELKSTQGVIEPKLMSVKKEDEPLKNIESMPSIKAQYYSAEAIQALPYLKPLALQEAEYNKIIFKLNGYPKEKEIMLDVKRLASQNPKAYENKLSFIIQDDDLLLIKNTQQRLKNIISSSRGFLPGERVTYRFHTADNSINKEISGVPTPAVIKNKEGLIVVKAELISINPTIYKIELPLMNEGEVYDMKSTSIGEITKAKPTYSKSMPINYAPAGSNKSKGGEGVLEIQRKNGESYKITLPWGAQLDDYLQGKRVYSQMPQKK